MIRCYKSFNVRLMKNSVTTSKKKKISMRKGEKIQMRLEQTFLLQELMKERETEREREMSTNWQTDRHQLMDRWLV